MFNVNETTGWIALAAWIIGLIFGGKFMLMLMQNMSNMFGARHYQPRSWNMRHHPENMEGGSGCMGVLILVGFIGLLFFFYTNSTKFEGLLSSTNRGLSNGAEFTEKKLPKHSPNDNVDHAEKAWVLGESDDAGDSYYDDTLPVPSPGSSEAIAVVGKVEISDPFIVQVGAFRRKAGAIERMEYLTNAGVRNGYFIKLAQDGDEIYVVFAGPYDTEKDAIEVRESLPYQDATVLSGASLELRDFASL